LTHEIEKTLSPLLKMPLDKYARKGTSVHVQGKLQIHTYKDKQQVERTSVEINAGNVQLLDKKPKEDELPDSVLPEA
jgi:single-stranded DNA-binding protein